MTFNSEFLKNNIENWKDKWDSNLEGFSSAKVCISL
ncbi:MAG: hypothetical protein CM15mP126_7530 [Gammaproteobacteria bacterium]|nr:MAG: hypothetical protein CM15mP126_7530 [Gammaproteobacteria bacterium]